MNDHSLMVLFATPVYYTSVPLLLIFYLAPNPLASKINKLGQGPLIFHHFSNRHPSCVEVTVWP